MSKAARPKCNTFVGRLASVTVCRATRLARLNRGSMENPLRALRVCEPAPLVAGFGLARHGPFEFELEQRPLSISGRQMGIVGTPGAAVAITPGLD